MEPKTISELILPLRTKDHYRADRESPDMRNQYLQKYFKVLHGDRGSLMTMCSENYYLRSNFFN
ncbi:MAG: hypothetical protein HN505_19730 [Verrucomicrobia bacterium]|nr:hypothetical protein [Verrucomicrobiota bacterium]MBT4274694.1 hypothetical protein [Verrucomicrobiota bacterium]MBT5062907.1 hypothetical protein [Verrucomicrobiota bacterium]MBT5480682.1 hypothetical protein [Verrucomicrobiota bacterium]MBT6239866.1 hypothetical protein [Verrucomicrobiota bacterium]